MDDIGLTGIFKAIGDEIGMERTTAAFAPFTELKVRWRRSDSFIDFAISDYFSEAPEGIVEMLAETLFERIYQGMGDYPEEFCEWVTSDGFIEMNRGKYLERCGALDGYVEEHHSLRKAYEDLVDIGYIDEIPGLVLRWTDSPVAQPKGMSSVLMRSVIMPTYMDTDAISEDAFEFNLYRLLLNVVAKFGEDPAVNKMRIDRKIAEYPDCGRLTIEIENSIPIAVYGGF